MEHLTPYLHFSNKLGKRGHKSSFFIPKGTQTKLQHLNLHLHLITFVPNTIPLVHGLPHHEETTSDAPFLFTLIATAMHQKDKGIKLLLKNLKPLIVFFDFQYFK
ncbi:putative anthocyanidin 3-O-glucoside 2''-O-glucosyltransferase [Lupinus albus]|uniref:Putative anthocyanidin 3-O-glucoside 2''-O-glucosyltransferase n=1 Tax=Lupinus albus TaxID=3870 RepID=A0A6A4P0T9_LUPAL|nr:putative anthocyanidin 3-O-glucoside 2''-O-glucosyltransferase [Lupinus albus]